MFGFLPEVKLSYRGGKWQEASVEEKNVKKVVLSSFTFFLVSELLS